MLIQVFLWIIHSLINEALNIYEFIKIGNGIEWNSVELELFFIIQTTTNEEKVCKMLQMGIV